MLSTSHNGTSDSCFLTGNKIPREDILFQPEPCSHTGHVKQFHHCYYTIYRRVYLPVPVFMRWSSRCKQSHCQSQLVSLWPSYFPSSFGWGFPTETASFCLGIELPLLSKVPSSCQAKSVKDKFSLHMPDNTLQQYGSSSFMVRLSKYC